MRQKPLIVFIFGCIFSAIGLVFSFQSGKARRGNRYLPVLLPLLPASAFAAGEAAQPAGEADIIHLLFEVLPATWEGWLGIVIAVCAILAVILPKPAKGAHPLLHLGYRLVCILGLGVSRLRGGGKLGAIARMGTIFRRVK